MTIGVATQYKLSCEVERTVHVRLSSGTDYSCTVSYLLIYIYYIHIFKSDIFYSGVDFRYSSLPRYALR